MKEIPLTQGRVALVDDEDFNRLSVWKWYYHYGYAVRREPAGKQRTIFMHREVAHTPDGMQTDHINLNRLDNRRSNLRACTAAENKANEGLRSSNKSGYRGVCWSARDNKWRANIHVGGKFLSLGCFDRAIDAAVAYDTAAEAYFGDFAKTNNVLLGWCGTEVEAK